MKRWIAIALLLLCAPAWAATYYVRQTDGNNADDGLTVANAWADPNYATDTVSAGDTIIICADGTYTLSAAWDADTVGGTNTARVYIIGAAADGTIDGTRPTITTASTLATGLLAMTTAADFYTFRNIIFDGGGVGKAEYCVNHTADGVDYNVWENCRFTNADNSGFLQRGTTLATRFVDCEFDNNGKSGTGNDRSHGGRPEAAGFGRRTRRRGSIHRYDHNALVAPISRARHFARAADQKLVEHDWCKHY